MKLDNVLILFAILFGALFGHYVADPSCTPQTRIIAVLVMVGVALFLSFCNSLLEQLDDVLSKYEIRRFFVNFEEEDEEDN